MGKFYMIIGAYEPCTAPTNRALSFINSFDKESINTQVIFLEPNITMSKIEKLNYEHIEVRYLWERSVSKQYIVNRLLTGIRITRFIKDLREGDKVFLFGVAKYLHKFVSKKGIEVYHERTEHPDVVRLRFAFERKRYIRNCKKLSGLFVISTALKNYFISIGVPEKKITIVNMTVDPNRFENVSKSTSVEKYIAYCGTASNNKDGVDRLIKAFAIVAQKHKDVKLYIIGRTPSSDDASGNLQLVDSLGIKDRVVFTGVVLAEQMPQLLTNAIILALARPNNLQAQNGFPTKLGEYLLTRNPVVVTKVGDIPLFLKDGESALLAEPDNIEEFADKLCWVLEHQSEGIEIGQKGRNVAMANFNASIETNKIINTISI